jgi:hypothetical protein
VDGDHPDDNHRTQGNYLDICSRAGCGGVCELRSTSGLGGPIPDQPRKRRRRTTKEAMLEREKADAESSVRVYTGEPFAATADVKEVAAGSFVRKPKTADFLTDRQRRQLLAEDFPVLAFPRSDGMPPVIVKEVYEMTSSVSIAVLGIKETTLDYIVLYEIHDDRTPSLRIKAKLPPDPKAVTGMPKTEYEPEPITKKEESELARKSRQEEIASLEEAEAEAKSRLEKLEVDSTSESTFHLKRQLEDWKGRRERLEEANGKAA